MKLRVATTPGHIVKGDVLLQVDGADAQEFELPADGNKFGCYVLTKPGDALIARSAVNLEFDVEEFVDVVVDGVLRATSVIKKGVGKVKKPTIHKPVFEKVLFYRYDNGKKKGLKIGPMEAMARENVLELPENLLSTVGTVQLQFWRKYPEGAAGSTSAAEPVKRAPNFEESHRWSDLKLSPETSLSEFEVGLSGGTQSWKVAKERLLEERNSFTFFASCTFRLASSEALRKLDLGVPTSPDPADQKEEPQNRDSTLAQKLSTTGNKKPKSEGPSAPVDMASGQKPANISVETVMPSGKDALPSTMKKPHHTNSKLSVGLFQHPNLEDDIIMEQFDIANARILSGLNPADLSEPSEKKKKPSKKRPAVLHGMPGGPASKVVKGRALTEEPHQSTPSEREISVAATEPPTATPNKEFEEYDSIFQSMRDDSPVEATLHVKAINADGKPEPPTAGQEPLTPPPSARKPYEPVSQNVMLAINTDMVPDVEILGEEQSATQAEPQAEPQAIIGVQTEDATPDQINSHEGDPKASSNAREKLANAGDAGEIGRLVKELKDNDCDLETLKKQSEGLSRKYGDLSESVPLVLQDPAPPRSPILIPQYQEEPQTPDTQRMGPPTPNFGSSPVFKHRRRVSFAEVSPSEEVRRAWQDKSTSEMQIQRREGDDRTSRSVSPSPIPMSPRLHAKHPSLRNPTPTPVLSKPISFTELKRKSIEISGGDVPEDSQPRKRSTTPKTTDAFERRTLAAQARIAAAREEEQRLAEETLGALAHKAEREKVLSLEMQALELERENEETKAMIAAIYAESTTAAIYDE